MSHIVFGMGGISSQELVLVAPTAVGDCVVVEMMMIFRALCGVYALHCGLLEVWWLLAFIIFFSLASTFVSGAAFGSI